MLRLKLYIVTLIALLSINGCQKTDVISIPELNTLEVINITNSSATSGGKVISDGGSNITLKGVCWSTSPSPTINDPKTEDGSGIGNFISNLNDLNPNISYYVRAYATNNLGTGYGNLVTFKTIASIPSITTDEIIEINQLSAKCKSNLISENGSPVTKKGICWSITENPTTNDSKTEESLAIGIYTSILSNLESNTKYYVRSYATNSVGTAYGNTLSFSTKSIQFVYDFDGNPYQIIQIGSQYWTHENLKVTHYSNGDPIPNILDNNDWKKTSTGTYCYYSNSSSNADTYGVLYNWYAVDDSRGICPTGWHIPTDSDWITLIDYLGGVDIAGAKMKSTRTAPAIEPRWDSPNTGATNESGFSGLPGGFRDHNGNFTNKGLYGFWWHRNEFNPAQSNYQILRYNKAITDDAKEKKEYGMSVRFIKD